MNSVLCIKVSLAQLVYLSNGQLRHCVTRWDLKVRLTCQLMSANGRDVTKRVIMEVNSIVSG